MSKKKKQESKKDRKKRCERSNKKPYITMSKQPEFKMPETFEEAVMMGMLR